MKKIFKTGKYGVLLALLLTAFACDDFLNRPTEDSYSIDGFYKTDEQCFQAANVLYNSPWYDFQRGFMSIGDVMAGNYFVSADNEYQFFNITSANRQLADASNSLWLVNGHASAVIENIATKASSSVSQQVKNTVTGEAMTWKSMAYFFLVRGWGAVPIIHSNSAVIGDGTATSVKKNKVEDVYEYIIRTLKKAASLLPENNLPGRLDRYSAYGLLSKVYLTRSGWGAVDINRNQNDLDSAKYYAYKVIAESGRVLEPVYANLFRISTGNNNSENLISWRWVISGNWTSQNTLQADMSLSGFSGSDDGWGQWSGPSIYLQQIFDEDALSKDRNNYDARRKATMMMFSDYYPYFYRHLGGFTATWDDKNNVANIKFGNNVGANCVKHIVGHNVGDHLAESGVEGTRMQTNLATHILRLADVYLIYAEAVLGNNVITTDAEALKYYNAVCARSIPTWTPKTQLTFDEIRVERIKEFAFEADNWYDYVRLSYYNPTKAIELINAQERGSYSDNLAAYYLGTSTSPITINSKKASVQSVSQFTIPFPDVDLAMNPNLRDNVQPVSYDFSSLGY